MCLFRSNVSLKPFPQNVHRYRLTSEWHFICLLRRRWRANVLLQIRQAKFVCPSSVVIDATLVFSSFLELLLVLSWLANGFLMPCPPLTNSSWTSAGSPNCKRNWNITQMTWGFTSQVKRSVLIRAMLDQRNVRFYMWQWK